MLPRTPKGHPWHLLLQAPCSLSGGPRVSFLGSSIPTHWLLESIARDGLLGSPPLIPGPFLSNLYQSQFQCDNYHIHTVLAPTTPHSTATCPTAYWASPCVSPTGTENSTRPPLTHLLSSSCPVFLKGTTSTQLSQVGRDLGVILVDIYWISTRHSDRHQVYERTGNSTKQTWSLLSWNIYIPVVVTDVKRTETSILMCYKEKGRITGEP